MTDRELMQQALEALNHVNVQDRVQIITALRERLAQPEQKPVAWGVFDGPNLHDTFFTEEDAQYMVKLKGDGSVVEPLYTSPSAQRKPLTDDEIYKIANDLFYGNGPCDTLAMCRAIEAAHGIKE